MNDKDPVATLLADPEYARLLREVCAANEAVNASREAVKAAGESMQAARLAHQMVAERAKAVESAAYEARRRAGCAYERDYSID